MESIDATISTDVRSDGVFSQIDGWERIIIGANDRTLNYNFVLKISREECVY